MELLLTDTMDITIDGSSDIELPSYVKRLTPEDVSKDTSRAELIIAAGTDPNDQKVTLITGNGMILIFDSKKYCIPDGPAVPYDGGKQVFFENLNERWPGDSKGFFIDSISIIEKSVSALTGATLQVNYPHENKP